MEVTAKDKGGNVLFNDKKTYVEIGVDTDRDMRYGAWQIKELIDLTLQPKDTQKEKFHMIFKPETDRADIEVTVTYCLSGAKCNVVHKATKTLTYTVD